MRLALREPYERFFNALTENIIMEIQWLPKFPAPKFPALFSKRGNIKLPKFPALFPKNQSNRETFINLHAILQKNSVIIE